MRYPFLLLTLPLLIAFFGCSDTQHEEVETHEPAVIESEESAMSEVKKSSPDITAMTAGETAVRPNYDIPEIPPTAYASPLTQPNQYVERTAHPDADTYTFFDSSVTLPASEREKLKAHLGQFVSAKIPDFAIRSSLVAYYDYWYRPKEAVISEESTNLRAVLTLDRYFWDEGTLQEMSEVQLPMEWTGRNWEPLWQKSPQWPNIDLYQELSYGIDTLDQSWDPYERPSLEQWAHRQ